MLKETVNMWTASEGRESKELHAETNLFFFSFSSYLHYSLRDVCSRVHIM